MVNFIFCAVFHVLARQLRVIASSPEKMYRFEIELAWKHKLSPDLEKSWKREFVKCNVNINQINAS